MGRLYLDHHDLVRFDPTPDGREAKAAARPKALLLIIAELEKTPLSADHQTDLNWVRAEIMLTGQA